jgi:hypothetical protein
MVSHTAIRCEEVLAIRVPCVSEVVFTVRDVKSSFTSCVCEDSSVMRRAFPTSEYVAELQIEFADSEDVLGKPALAVSIGRRRLSSADRGVDVGTIEGTQAVSEVWGVLTVVRDARGERLIDAGQSNVGFVEGDAGAEDIVEGSE